MSRILYARVSTPEQHLARQLVESKKFDKVYEEKVSGKNTDERPKLKEMLEYVREGDVIEVESYNRLARNTRDLLEIVDTFSALGVVFISHKENIDTSTPQGRLMFTIFAGLAQFERECMLQRQAEGIAIAKAEGRYTGDQHKGRQKIMPDEVKFDEVYRRWKAGGITARKAMADLGMKPNTFYRRVKEFENA